MGWKTRRRRDFYFENVPIAIEVGVKLAFMIILTTLVAWTSGVNALWGIALYGILFAAFTLWEIANQLRRRNDLEEKRLRG